MDTSGYTSRIKSLSYWIRSIKLGFTGLVIGLTYAIIENLWKGTPLAPLLLRAGIGGFLIFFSISWFEALMRDWFRKRTFLVMLLIKSVVYVLIFSFWLILANGISDMITKNVSFMAGILEYLNESDMYLNNLLTLTLTIVLINILIMINSLHRPGELLSFILGRYHKPLEVERIFLFIDLNDSTTIAEEMGNRGFGSFLQEYYMDVSKAVADTGGMIYDYIGDEVIISWKLKDGLRKEQCLKCYFRLKNILSGRESYYMESFGRIPKFKAGMHMGKVVVMWVGDYKKEISYLGDVLNTTKRIQTECDRYQRELLISGSLLKKLGPIKSAEIKHLGSSALKGKQEKVELYGID